MTASDHARDAIEEWWGCAAFPVQILALEVNGRTIAQALDDGDDAERFLAFVCDTQPAAATEAAVAFVREAKARD